MMCIDAGVQDSDLDALSGPSVVSRSEPSEIQIQSDVIHSGQHDKRIKFQHLYF
jgi:hypothetical protein